MAQIRQVVSESLQATIRRLLPSQQGFTEDLQASNVITPIIDLTPTAEGSALPEYLQTALTFGDATSFTYSSTTSATVINSTGFWRVFGTAGMVNDSGASMEVSFNVTDGLSNKKLWGLRTVVAGSNTLQYNQPFDFVVLLSAGDSLTYSATSTGATVGSYRQIADINGNLVNPDGYSPQ